MLKKILIGLLIFLLITYLVAFLIWKTIKNDFSKSHAFKIALQQVMHDKKVLKEAGGIIELENFGGTLYQDSATIEFKVKGKNKIIFAEYRLVRKDTVWAIVGFNVFTKSL